MAAALADGGPRWRGGSALAVAALALAAAAFAGAHLAGRTAAAALLNLGPNDLDYVSGFREGWERDADGLTRFHWTLGSSVLRLPVEAVGEGFRLRFRYRRHLIEPAQVSVIVEGRAVAGFVARAHDAAPYHVVDMPLPALAGRGPFTVLIRSRSADPRPFGIALDWVELVRTGPSARFRLPHATATALAVLTAATFAFLVASGASLGWAAAGALAVLVVGVLGVRMDIVAAERILRLGGPSYLAGGVGALALVRWRRSRAWLRIETPPAAALLQAIVLAALALRLVLLLHPQFFYPDVRVHALFAAALARRGLGDFLEGFTEDQFRHSLGLQFEHGHWYAFPYPPAFYMLCWPLIRWAGYRPEVAVALPPALLNSLEVLAVYAIGRRLLLPARTALAGAAALPLLPIFIVRLGLAYFPAVTGHAVDTVVLLFLVTHLGGLKRVRVVVALGALLALAFLTYTQSLLNFGILLPLLMAFALWRDHSRGGLRWAGGLAAAGILGVVLSLGFYGRYIPTFIDMQRGIPMPQEQVLLDKIQHQPPWLRDAPPEPADDPFAGPGLDLWRGVKKAAWRAYVFYGLFAPVLAAGLLLLLRSLQGNTAWLVAAWALTYLILNLASGGLPGPNLVRYNKDLEVVAPLCCLALGAAGAWLYSRARVLGIGFGLAWAVFGARRWVRALTDTFVLER